MNNSHIDKTYYTYEEYQKQAKESLSHQNYTYFQSGADDEITLKRNETALKSLLINPRICIDVSKIDTSLKVFGSDVSFPFGISPTAFNRLAHPEGERNNARAAQNNKIIYVLSSISTYPIQEIAKVSNKDAINWYQFYVKDMETTQEILKVLEKNNFKAVVITVDRPKLGKRIGDKRNDFSVPSDFKIDFFNTKKQKEGLMLYQAEEISATLNWADIIEIKKMTKLPLILKGIQSYKDAKKCAEIGVHVWVSNHGGRQLDTVRATIEMLAECVQGVKDSNMQEISVFADGGVRNGSDILKFLSLGASYVFTGRGVVYANSSEGQRGIEKYLRQMKEEFITSMQVSGKVSIKQIDEKCIIKRTIPQSNL